MSVTASSKALQRVSCIWYLIEIQDSEVQALIDFGYEVNAMTPAYAKKLAFTPQKTSVEVQKINGCFLETYNMTSASFSFQDSQKMVRFFEKSFLLANTNMEVVLRMPFLALSNADVEFTELGKLTWRSYITVEALSTTSQIELIDKREFARVGLDENSETFVIHVAVLEVPTAMPIHLSRIS